MSFDQFGKVRLMLESNAPTVLMLRRIHIVLKMLDNYYAKISGFLFHC